MLVLKKIDRKMKFLDKFEYLPKLLNPEHRRRTLSKLIEFHPHSGFGYIFGGTMERQVIFDITSKDPGVSGISIPAGNAGADRYSTTNPSRFGTTLLAFKTPYYGCGSSRNCIGYVIIACQM